MNYTERLLYTGSPEYDKHFWNAMRGSESSYAGLSKGSTETGTYQLPNSASNKYMAALEKESLFRNIGTFIKAYGSGHRIFAKDSTDFALWVAEGEAIPIYDGIDDFTINTVDSWKLAAFVKMDESFISLFYISGHHRNAAWSKSVDRRIHIRIGVGVYCMRT